MVLSTQISRLSDGLPLSASVDDESDLSKLAEPKKQLKMIMRKISPNSEPRASIESGNYSIHYLISHDFVYFCITDHSYPRKLAFSYLEELDQEFAHSYGNEAVKPGLRPFAFVQFDNFIQKTKRVYQDARATTNLDRLNTELQDVTKVMTKNIEDLLYRGETLDKMDDLSTSLRSESKKYRRAARRINIEAMIKQYAPFAGIGLIFIFLIWWIFLR
uniref:Protein transport protein SEC22 n=1 Tax=Blastobotrys adeninivorans TaxID=409370 RepID=A0A060T2J2_BLAAD